MSLLNPISDRSNLELTLQPQEEFHLTQLLIEPTANAVFWVDTDATFLYVNNAACCLTGYCREELLSMTVDDIEPKLLPNVWSKFWQTIKQQGSFYFESLEQTKETTATYLEYQGREYCCIFIRDLIKSKQLELSSDSIFPSHPKLSKVFDYIEANYHQAITLSDVAQAVVYSPAYLTDLVRRQTGKTVNHWIVERRMTEARRLLVETNQKANEIASLVGYQNEVHFFRQFRKYHGTTPQVWRNLQRNQ